MSNQHLPIGSFLYKKKELMFIINAISLALLGNDDVVKQRGTVFTLLSIGNVLETLSYLSYSPPKLSNISIAISGTPWYNQE